MSKYLIFPLLDHGDGLVQAMGIVLVDQMVPRPLFFANFFLQIFISGHKC